MNMRPFVRDRERFLPLKRHSSQFQLDLHRSLIRRFQKSRPQMAVHLNARAYYSVHDVFDVRGQFMGNSSEHD